MRGERASANGGACAAIACKQFNGKGQRKVTKEGRKEGRGKGTTEGRRHTPCERKRERGAARGGRGGFALPKLRASGLLRSRLN